MTFELPLKECDRCGADEFDAFDCMADDCAFAILGRYMDEARQQSRILKATTDGVK